MFNLPHPLPIQITVGIGNEVRESTLLAGQMVRVLYIVERDGVD